MAGVIYRFGIPDHALSLLIMTPFESDKLDTAWSVQQLAQATGMNPKSIQKACRDGRISATKVMRGWRIPGEVARAFVNGREPGKRLDLEKVPTQDIVAELEQRQDTEIAVIVTKDHGLEVDGGAFRHSSHGDFYRRQINHYLNEAYREARTNPREPTGIDPANIFRYTPGMI